MAVDGPCFSQHPALCQFALILCFNISWYPNSSHPWLLDLSPNRGDNTCFALYFHWCMQCCLVILAYDQSNFMFYCWVSTLHTTGFFVGWFSTAVLFLLLRFCFFKFVQSVLVIWDQFPEQRSHDSFFMGLRSRSPLILASIQLQQSIVSVNKTWWFLLMLVFGTYVL